MPVPEKAQRQFAFCVIPAGGDGVSAGAEEEAMVWVVVDAVGKKRDGDADGEGKGKGKDAGYKGYVRGLLDVGLGLVGKGVVEPEEREFASALVQAHRKGERAWHVGAWRGSKDGMSCPEPPFARQIHMAGYQAWLATSRSLFAFRTRRANVVPPQDSSSSSAPASSTPSRNPSSSSRSTPSTPSRIPLSCSARLT